MKKIPTSPRLFPGMLLVAVAGLFLSVVSGCGPHQDEGHHGGGDSIVINEDTLRNHVISIGQAIEYTKAFRALLDTNRRIRPDVAGSLNLSYAEEFPSDVFYDLLKQTSKTGSAKGIRIYLGRDPQTGQLRMVLVPVDSLGNDIINHLVDQGGRPAPSNAKAVPGNGGQAFEEGQECPTACGNGDSGL
jgi:hypothetical protein